MRGLPYDGGPCGPVAAIHSIAAPIRQQSAPGSGGMERSNSGPLGAQAIEYLVGRCVAFADEGKAIARDPSQQSRRPVVRDVELPAVARRGMRLLNGQRGLHAIG